MSKDNTSKRSTPDRDKYKDEIDKLRDDMHRLNEKVQAIRAAYPWGPAHDEELLKLIDICRKDYGYSNFQAEFSKGEWFEFLRRGGFYAPSDTIAYIAYAVAFINAHLVDLRNVLVDSGEQGTIEFTVAETPPENARMWRRYQEKPANVRRLEMLVQRALLEAAEQEIDAWLSPEKSTGRNYSTFTPDYIFESYSKVGRHLSRGYIRSGNDRDLPLEFNQPYRIADYAGDNFPDVVSFVKQGMEEMGILGLTPFDNEVQAASIAIFIENERRGGAQYQTDKQIAKLLQRNKYGKPTESLRQKVREAMKTLGVIIGHAQIGKTKDGEYAFKFSAPLVTPYTISKVMLNGQTVESAYYYPEGIAPFLWNYHRTKGNKQYRLIPLKEYQTATPNTPVEYIEGIVSNTKNDVPQKEVGENKKKALRRNSGIIGLEGQITRRIEEVRRTLTKPQPLKPILLMSDLYSFIGVDDAIAKMKMAQGETDAAFESRKRSKLKNKQRAARQSIEKILKEKKAIGVISSYEFVADNKRPGKPITAIKFVATPYEQKR